MGDGVFDTIKGRVLHLLGDADCQNLTVRGRLRRPGGQPYYPTGLIQPWPWSAAPTGALTFDGATYPSSRYPALAQIVNPGGATFTLPDWRGRTLIGAGTGAGLSNRVLGSTYGSEDLKSHAHSHNHGSHAHGATWNDAGNPQVVVGQAASTIGLTGTNKTNNATYDSAPNITVQGTTPSTDSTTAGTGADNLQPSYAVNWIIWT